MGESREPVRDLGRGQGDILSAEVHGEEKYQGGNLALPLSVNSNAQNHDERLTSSADAGSPAWFLPSVLEVGPNSR